MNCLKWINTIKALCMIGVYILHTQAFNSQSGGGNSLISSVISPFYVNAFFVVSGYLFFKKWSNLPVSIKPGRKDVGNLIYRLLIPTILFSSIIYLPKLLYHARAISFDQYLYDVLGGISFWFTSAMVVAQTVFLVLLKAGLRKYRDFITLSALFAVMLPLLRHISPSPFPWYWKSGMAAVIFMTLGGMIYRFREWFKSYLILITIIVCLGYAIAVTYSILTGNAQYAAMSAKFNIQGILVTLAGIGFIFLISYRWIPDYRILQFIGNNSIVFYFFSGVIPATLSSLPIINNFSGVIGLLGLSSIAVAIGVLMTWIIVRYMPFLTDLRKIKNETKK